MFWKCLMSQYFVLSRPAEAEILWPDSKRVLHSSDRAPWRQSFGRQGPASDPNTAPAWHGNPPQLFKNYLEFMFERIIRRVCMFGAIIVQELFITKFWFIFLLHSHQKSGEGSPVSSQFWRQGSKSLHQEALPLVLWILVSAISVWTRPPPPWQVPPPHLREVEEHLTALDLGLLSHKNRATPAAG